MYTTQISYFTQLLFEKFSIWWIPNYLILKQCLCPYVKWWLSLLNFNLKCNANILIYTTCKINSRCIILLNITYETKTWNENNTRLKTEAVWPNKYGCYVLKYVTGCHKGRRFMTVSSMGVQTVEGRDLVRA